MSCSRLVLILAGLLAVVAGLISMKQGEGPGPRVVGASQLKARKAESPGKTPQLLVPGAKPGGTQATVSQRRVIRLLPFGSGPGQIGRGQTGDEHEGHLSRPMAFTPDASGNLWVVDRGNQRLLQMSPQGELMKSTPLPSGDVTDVAVTPSGQLMVLEGEENPKVSLMSPDGRVTASLPVGGKNIDDASQVSGVFADGEDVLVEYQYGDTVRVGSTSGGIDAERAKLPGKPTRDGRFYFSAGISDPSTGRFTVTLIAHETQQHVFTRELRLPAELLSVFLVDSDKRGTLYVGLETRGSAAAPQQNGLHLVCIDSSSGTVTGIAEIPAAPGDPETTFREARALDEGGVVYAIWTPQGVRYETHNCR